MTAPELKDSGNLAGLKDKLREMFQLDRADLDFGIYRIMNAKKDEVARFLDRDLLPQVRKSLAGYQPAEMADLERELAEIEKNPDKYAPGYAREARKKLDEGFDVSRVEEEVYSHLLTFFSRYYHDGDFMSLRRYKEGVYALPYEGEEVKLHWANADQYYIKSSESFKNYMFKLPGGKRVRFDLVSAGAERDDVKAAAGKERRFILDRERPLALDGDDLILRFQYRSDGEKRKQAALNALAAGSLLGLAADAPTAAGITDWPVWREALAAKAPTEKNPDRALLEKHLAVYTARNSFDYFIHKDLNGFLRRELDFFIKNEIMHLDDIENESAPRAEQYLSKIKAMRGIAHKIIDFLGGLEDFQKKLWLKKKFVLETNWLVTLDRVPEDIHAEIAANDVQRAEWVKLFAIDEITADLGGSVAYSAPLTGDFLKANPFLVLDTAFFDRDFKDRILASFENLDEETDGLLIHGENFQALSMLENGWRSTFDYSYIDPPYNTGDDGFLYKDNYKHSSWMALISDRICKLIPLLKEKGVSSISIDRDENRNLLPLCFELFGEDNFIEEIVWQKAYGGGAKTRLVNNLHEYVIAFARDKSQLPVFFHSPDPEAIKYYKYTDEKYEFRGKYRTQPLATNSNDPRENLTYPLPCPTCLPNKKSEWEAQWNDIRNLLNSERLDVVQNVRGWHVKFMDDSGNEAPWWGKVILPPMQWQWGWLKAKTALTNNELIYERKNEEWVVNYKQYRFNEQGEERGQKPPSVMVGPYTQRGTDEVRHLFGYDVTKFPKPVGLIKDIVSLEYQNKNAQVIDFFAGSGTTGHAVMDLNREDNGNRRFVLVEVGDHFDTVLKPRISKVIYSPDWKDGKPVSREGSSHLIKYLRLESYEDATDNLVLSRTEEQQRLIEQHDEFREDYTIRYMLDVESRDSLLDIGAFADPFSYGMTVVRDDERKRINVDLIETFNYLLGLRVRTRERVRGVYVISGLSPHGEKVLVLWRNVAETGNDQLDAWFRKQDYNSRHMEFDLIYVNGDNNIENLKRPDETWKVRLIEQDFHTLMFHVENA